MRVRATLLTSGLLNSKMPIGLIQGPTNSSRQLVNRHIVCLEPEGHKLTYRRPAGRRALARATPKLLFELFIFKDLFYI